MAEFVYMHFAEDSGNDTCPECHCLNDNTSNQAVAHLSCGVVLCSGACSDRHAHRCRTGNAVDDEPDYSLAAFSQMKKEQTA